MKKEKPKGCNHGCVVIRPYGIATNGPCRCLEELPPEKRARIVSAFRWYRSEITRLTGERI